MGSYRLSLWSAFLAVSFPFLLLADFTSSDSANLSIIKTQLTGISGQLDDLVLLQGMSSDVHSISHYLYDPSNQSGIKTDVSQIRYWLSLIVDASTTPPDLGQRVFRVQDKPVEQSLSIVTNQNNHIISAINNLTNYLCYSPQYVAESFTNIAVNLGYFGMGNYNNWSDNSARTVFKYIYGYTPTSTELLDFKQYVQNYGPGLQFRQEFYSEVPLLTAFNSMNISFNNKSYNLGTLWNRYKAESVPETAQAFVHAQGNMRYYAYGTRELTDSFNIFTNTLLSLDPQYFSVSSSGSGGGSVVTPGGTFTTVVGGIKNSPGFTGTVGTNITGEVIKGPIAQLADNSYSSRMQQIENDTDPFSFSDLDGVLSELSPFQGAVEDATTVLTESDHSATYVLPMIVNFPHVGQQDISLTLENQTAVTGPYVIFFCWVLRFVICCFLFERVWTRVIVPAFSDGAAR